MNFKTKYNDIFKKKDFQSNFAITSLISYIQGSQNKNYSGLKDLIILINEAKKIKERKENKYPVLEKYLSLIENVISLIDVDDLNNSIIDDFCLTQLYLINFIFELIEMYIKNKPPKNINNILKKIIQHIENEYGKSYFDILDFLSIYKSQEHNKEINLYSEFMKYAYDIIINFHPKKLEEKINLYILNENNAFVINNFEFKPNFLNLQLLKDSLDKAFKDLIILETMKKYEKKSRYEYFIEFKEKNNYLQSINLILSKNKKLNFSSLNEEPDDIEFLKEKIEYLIIKGKETEQKIKDMEEQTKLKIKDMEEQTKLKIKDIEKDFQKKSKKLKKENKYLLKSIEDVYQTLGNIEVKEENYKIREVCQKFEDYFFKIIKHSTQIEIIQKINSNNPEKKIDLIVKAIKNEYPKFIKFLTNENINLISILQYLNEYCDETEKKYKSDKTVNKELLFRSLNSYFKNKIDLKTQILYMLANFVELKEFILMPNYKLKTDLYLYFTKKETELP